MEKRNFCRHIHLLNVACNLLSAYEFAESSSKQSGILSSRLLSLQCELIVSAFIRMIIDKKFSYVRIRREDFNEQCSAD